MTDNMLYNIWLEIGEMHYPESDRLRIAEPITKAIEKMDFFQHLHKLSENYPDFVNTSETYTIQGDFPYSAWTPVAWRNYIFVPISLYAEYNLFPIIIKKDGDEVFWNIPERMPKWMREPVLEIDSQNQKLKELRDELMHERGVSAMGGAPSSPGAIRALRLNIARILTVQKEEEEI